MNKGKTNKGKLNLQFLKACKCFTEKPDLARIKELVEQGADINAHDAKGFAALKWATQVYDRDVMRFFLEHGADINEVIHYKDNTVSTAWLNKVRYSQLEDLRLMLSFGARPNDCDSAGNTALLEYCAGNPVREGVALLLEHGASAKAVNKELNSALHLVARATVDPETVQLLIEAGCDVNLRNDMGDTPLHVNARFQLAGDERTAICLLEHGADRDALNGDGDTALLMAASCDKEFVVKALVDHGADKEIRNAAGHTALDIALSKAFLKTACHIDPNALVEYYKRAGKAGIDKIKRLFSKVSGPECIIIARTRKVTRLFRVAVTGMFLRTISRDLRRLSFRLIKPMQMPCSFFTKLTGLMASQTRPNCLYIRKF